MGGDVPYGQAIADNGINLVENLIEQVVIRQAQKLRTSGLSLRKIAAELQRRGHKPRNEKTFQPEQIRRMTLFAPRAA